jgi:hypothetical protein
MSDRLIRAGLDHNAQRGAMTVTVAACTCDNQRFTRDERAEMAAYCIDAPDVLPRGAWAYTAPRDADSYAFAMPSYVGREA